MYSGGVLLVRTWLTNKPPMCEHWVLFTSCTWSHSSMSFEYGTWGEEVEGVSLKQLHRQVLPGGKNPRAKANHSVLELSVSWTLQHFFSSPGQHLLQWRQRVGAEGFAVAPTALDWTEWGTARRASQALIASVASLRSPLRMTLWCLKSRLRSVVFLMFCMIPPHSRRLARRRGACAERGWIAISTSRQNWPCFQTSLFWCARQCSD